MKKSNITNHFLRYFIAEASVVPILCSISFMFWMFKVNAKLTSILVN